MDKLSSVAVVMCSLFRGVLSKTASRRVGACAAASFLAMYSPGRCEVPMMVFEWDVSTSVLAIAEDGSYTWMENGARVLTKFGYDWVLCSVFMVNHNLPTLRLTPISAKEGDDFATGRPLKLESGEDCVLKFRWEQGEIRSYYVTANGTRFDARLVGISKKGPYTLIKNGHTVLRKFGDRWVECLVVGDTARADTTRFVPVGTKKGEQIGDAGETTIQGRKYRVIYRFDGEKPVMLFQDPEGKELGRPLLAMKANGQYCFLQEGRNAGVVLGPCPSGLFIWYDEIDVRGGAIGGSTRDKGGHKAIWSDGHFVRGDPIQLPVDRPYADWARGEGLVTAE